MNVISALVIARRGGCVMFAESVLGRLRWPGPDKATSDHDDLVNESGRTDRDRAEAHLSATGKACFERNEMTFHDKSIATCTPMYQDRRHRL